MSNFFFLSICFLLFIPQLCRSALPSILTEYHISSENPEVLGETERLTTQSNTTCLPHGNLRLSHHFGRGPGHKGYSSTELFFIQTKDYFVPFLDLKLHVMNEGKVAFNTGGGFRALLDSPALSIGGNIYYDYRASMNLHTHQIAGGVELLSSYVDFRLNGYLPVGGTKHSNPLTFAGFAQQSINVSRETYYAFPSANAEIGIPIPWVFPDYVDLYVAIGPYYLFGNAVSGNHYQSSWGMKLRLTAELFRFGEVGFELNYDDVFKTTYQGFAGIRIPLGKSTACRPASRSLSNKACNKRTLQPVIRNEIIPIKKKSVTDSLKNEFGHLVNVIFVNNLATTPGLGTFSSPYASLALAESSAPSGRTLIYVFQGDGTTSKYNTGFVMKPGQVLLGSGTPISLHNVTIPALTLGNPTLTNPAGSGVTLASHTIVKGFNIQNTSAKGIFGDGVSNVNISDNHIISSASNGIYIENSGAISLILDNEVLNSGDTGIFFSSLNTGGQCYIGNNTISDSNGGGDGIIARVNHPNFKSIVTSNTITQTGPGSGLSDISTRILQGTLVIDKNVLNSTSSRGILAFDGVQIITNNQITNFTTAGGQGIFYSTNNGNSGLRNGIISNNRISINSHSNWGIDVANENTPGDISAQINRNQVTTSDPNKGIRVRTSNPGTACASVTSNTASNFTLNGSGGGNVKISQSETNYMSSNTGTNFSETGSVTFDTDCYSAP